MAFTLAELAAPLAGEALGDTSAQLSRVAPLDRAGPDDLAFLVASGDARELAASHAGALILAPAMRDATDRPRIIHPNPYLAFARAQQLFHPAPVARGGRHPSAQIDPAARVDASAQIDACAVVEAGARIGARSIVGAGCFIGRDAEIGADALLHARVAVYHGCVVGDRAILHAGCVIGSDGFGFADDAGRWEKIPQVGRVVLGDDVEVGANTAIDRGALDDTVIGDGVKIDNLVHIAHNCVIGDDTAIAGCTGFGGGAIVGRRCRFGGAAMIQGHLRLADDVTVSGGTTITKSLLKPGVYTSVQPSMPHADWMKNAAHLRHLDKLANRVKALEQALKSASKNKEQETS
jgi:UDP-3-O-[3-hydroxymyristoyl] glucosamine N-acyltransferase